MGADSRNEFPFWGTCPVVQSDAIVLPSVTLPLKVESPASRRALEESLKTGGIIFLTDRHLKVGTLCRVSRKLVPVAGGESLVGWGFIIEGLERGVALSVKGAEGFSLAEVSSDPTPDEVSDVAQLKALDKEVRRLVGKLLSLLPEEEVYGQHSPGGGIAGLFNLQDITSPSRLADHTAFLLSLLGLVSTEQQRAVLETFRPDYRLEALLRILTEELETRQLQALLLKRMERRYPTRPLLPQKFLDKFERGLLYHLREFHPKLTALSRRQYVSTLLLQAVDEAIESLLAEAGVKVEQDRREIHDERLDPLLSRREAKKVALTVGRRRSDSAKRRLGVRQGSPKGIVSKRKGLKEAVYKQSEKRDAKIQLLTEAAYRLFVLPQAPPTFNYQLLATEIGKSKRTIERWVEDTGLTLNSLLKSARKVARQRQK